jgi:hypothetical protein
MSIQHGRDALLSKQVTVADESFVITITKLGVTRLPFPKKGHKKTLHQDAGF